MYTFCVAFFAGPKSSSVLSVDNRFFSNKLLFAWIMYKLYIWTIGISFDVKDDVWEFVELTLNH